MEEWAVSALIELSSVPCVYVYACLWAHLFSGQSAAAGSQTRDTLPCLLHLVCSGVLSKRALDELFCNLMFCSNKKQIDKISKDVPRWVSVRAIQGSSVSLQFYSRDETTQHCHLIVYSDLWKRLLSLLIQRKPVSPVHFGFQHQTNKLVVWVLADSETTVVSVTETHYPLFLSIWHLNIKPTVKKD